MGNHRRDHRTLLVRGLLVRLTLLVLGLLLDNVSSKWRYTDIDYDVFSDAAGLVAEGISPFERATYRYSPFIAHLLLLNRLHPAVGKAIFASFDLAISLEIFRIRVAQGESETDAERWAMLWALNPVSSYIATRGSLDSVSNYLVLLLLRLALQGRETAAGLVLGLVVHLRIYPVIYLPAILCSLWSREGDSLKSFRFLAGFVASFMLLFVAAYSLDGDAFLQHALLYHLSRSDHRHNFSVYFYPIYLAKSSALSSLLLKATPLLSQVTVLAALLWRFASEDLLFCLFLQTIVFVAFNKVITGQYFMWFIALFPVALSPELLFKLFSPHCFLPWLLSFGLWLCVAFLLEMQGQDVFLPVWFASIVFLCANVHVVRCLIAGWLQQRQNKFHNSIILR